MFKAEHRRPIDVEDLFSVRWVDAPRLSGDGQQLACTVTWLDRMHDAMRTEVVCDGWTQAGHSPCWSPDGNSLAFVAVDGAPDAASAQGSAQIGCWDRQSRHTHQLTHLPQDCSQPAWSPDGNWLAFVAAGKLWLVTPDGRESRLFGGQAVAAFCWLANSRGLVWSTVQQSDGYTQIWWSGMHGQPELLYTQPGPVSVLVCAPDSSAVAWIGHDRWPAPGINLGVWWLPLARGSAPTLLTVGFDRCVGLTTRADDARGLQPPDLIWLCLNGEDRIYFLYAEGGASHIGWVGLDRQVHPVVTGARSCLAFSVAQAVRLLVCVVADALQPGEVLAVDMDGSNEQWLTTHNRPWLDSLHLSPHEPLTFVASDGTPVDAWLLLPSAHRQAGPYPLILQIHGGPHYAIGHRFYFEFQRLAAQGYAVLFGNPRGSQGYGEHFATQIRAAWGKRDYADMLEMLDVALQHPAVDPDRLAVTGVSYGGYMTHTLIGRTQRFRAAISENGVSNLTTNHRDGAHPAFWEWEMEGTPATQPERYRTLSPLHLASQIRTPLLLIHAEQDVGCPIGQSEEMAVALQATGCPVELLRVPEEGHLMNLVGRPSRRLARAAAIDRWLDRWLQSAS
jgi:dipeptidyl aminopeptidase/acylaminoacyl peptidase